MEAQVVAHANAGSTSYARRLTLFDGIMVVVGGIIGAGIFLNPAIVAQRVTTSGLILAVWALGGAIALLGALCFGELGSRRPDAGGGYVYLREAFGPLFGFLYGWMMLLVSATGAIAALAVTFARYTVDVAAMSEGWVKPVAVGAIVLLTGINYFGVRPGSITQNIFTVLKLAALAVLIVVGLAWGGAASSSATSAASSAASAGGAAASAGGAAADPAGAAGLMMLIGAALIPVLFSYGGWQHANHIAGEMIRPKRHLPRALLIGVAVVVVTYLLANAAYVYTLGPAGLAASLAPASDVMRAVLGETGSTFIGLGIVASTFGILNLYIMAAPRVYQAMADDNLFFKRFARLHPRYKTPSGPILLQAGWGIVLTLSGTYSQLLDYVVFGDWIFFALVVATLFVYRRDRHAGAGSDGAFRMPGYPLLPALFVLVSVFVVYSSVVSNPWNALVGAVLIGLGIPIYAFWKGKGSPAQSD